MCDCWQECEHTRCRVCRSKEMEYKHTKTIVPSENPWVTYFRCSSCGYTWQES